MANKLAGQKAKFTKAFIDYKSTKVEATRTHAVQQMLEVVNDAPGNGFSEAHLTRGRDVPAEVLRKWQAAVRCQPPPTQIRSASSPIGADDQHLRLLGRTFRQPRYVCLRLSLRFPVTPSRAQVDNVKKHGNQRREC